MDYSNNLIIGYHAGQNISSGKNNILIGQHAGENLTTGSNCIIIANNHLAPSPDADGYIYVEGMGVLRPDDPRLDVIKVISKLIGEFSELMANEMRELVEVRGNQKIYKVIEPERPD